jgi:cadmium resistance protein CadD (predicted permease)
MIKMMRNYTDNICGARKYWCICLPNCCSHDILWRERKIGIYASLFATNNEFGEIITLVTVSMALTGIWCGIANYLVNHSFLTDHFRRISKSVLPLVLIGLGIYILADAFLLQSFI